jgi:hypothetical protein
LHWARGLHGAHLDLRALDRALWFDCARLFNGALRLDGRRGGVRRLETLRLVEVARRLVGSGVKRPRLLSRARRCCWRARLELVKRA